MLRRWVNALSSTFMALAVACMLLAPAEAGSGCAPDEMSQNKCFATSSGYEFRIVESSPVACGPALSVSGFPHILPNGDKLWCYDVTTPAAKVSSLNQVNLQIPLSFYDTTGPVAIPLLVPNTLYSQFAFSKTNGCLGDSTSGFEVGDVLNCGMKWTVRLNPTGQSSRFYYVSPAAIAVAVEPKIMAPKVGNSLEPGLILGARALLDAPPYTPQAKYVCNEVAGNFYRFAVDDYGCPTGEIENCGADAEVKCSQACDPLPTETPRIGIFHKNSDGNPDLNDPIMGTTENPYKTLKEIGDLFGNRFCPSGHMTTTGSLCTTYYIGGRLTRIPTGCIP